MEKEKLENIKKDLRNLLSMQENNLIDTYNIGLYNGFEFALSMIEEREPRFEATDPEILLEDRKLEKMFSMRKEFQSKLLNKPQEIFPMDDVDQYRYTMLALVSEIGEILSCDKRWKDFRKPKVLKIEDREAKDIEIVDLLKFVFNLCLFSNIDCDYLYHLYIKKHKINMERLHNQIIVGEI